MIFRVCLYGVLLAWLFGVGTAFGESRPRLVSSSLEGVIVALDGSDFGVDRVVLDGRSFDRVSMGDWLPEVGAPAVPVRGALLGVPFGASLQVLVVEVEYEEIPNVDLMPVPKTRLQGRDDGQIPRPVFEPDPAFYARDAFYPAEHALIARTGQLRDQKVAALSLRPVQYHPLRKVLRIARRLVVEVRFVPGATRPVVRPSNEGGDHVFETLYQRALLNAEGAQPWRGRPLRAEKVQANWYYPTATYYKIRIREDGMYRLDTDWFLASGIALGPGDLDRLRLLLNGQTQPLWVEDGGDGNLDAGDGVYFYGQFRRTSGRDFESELGPEFVYWLTLDGGQGTRFERVDATPQNGFPVATQFMGSVHVEIDSTFQALGLATDHLRDHWYYQRTASPSTPGGMVFPVTIPVVLPHLDPTAGGMAQVKMGMHGLTGVDFIDPDHRTVVTVGDDFVLADDRWDGQREWVVEGPVSVSELNDTTLVMLTTPGAPEYPFEPVPYIDHVYFNWVTVTYPRRYAALDGALTFDPGEVGEGRTIVISGFRTDTVRVVNLTTNQRLDGVETVGLGNGFEVRFEVKGGGRFVAVDSRALKEADRGVMDLSSDLRGEQTGAQYVIVTDRLFWDAAVRLADHRAAGGLSAKVVDVVDIYDEFSFGNLDPEAIRAFMIDAFDRWVNRPVYLMLFGRFSFDYRDLMGQAGFRRRNLVPGLPFQSVERGLSFTDEFYGRVAGDDVFMDVFVGRFSVNQEREADTVVDKVIAYDHAPPERWRDRMLYLANWDDLLPTLFTDPSDSMATTFAEPLGLESFKIYHDENTPPEPNETTQEMIRQINEGRLLVNFMGHGSSASILKFFRGTFQQSGFNYMRLLQNENRLPLFIGMSCLNGLYWDPRVICLAEEMTNKSDGGSIAYVSATSLAFTFINNFINISMFKHMFQNRTLDLGQALTLAKVDILTKFPITEAGVVMMNLMGDPAQKIAIPPGPDLTFPEQGVRLSLPGELTVSDSTRIEVRLENQGIVPDRGVAVVVVDRNLDQSNVDTLFQGVLPPFGQRDSLFVPWSLSGRSGRHLVEVVLDPGNLIAEVDEANNRAALEVEVFGTLTAVSTLPRESQVVSASAVRLGVRSGTPADDLIGEFEVSSALNFERMDVQRSGFVNGRDGLVVWQVSGLAPGTYFWRGRLRTAQEAGPWTKIRSFVATGTSPDRSVTWQQEGREAFAFGTPQNTVLKDDGLVARVQEPPSMQFDGAHLEAAFQADEVLGSAVLCTDGTYVYVKRFFTNPPIYRGIDFFVRIGTGLNGTEAGRNFGLLTETPVPGISATYHGDGFIYADDGKARELVRISPVSGVVDRVQVPDGLLELRTGLVFDGHSLLTSDGQLIYNVAAGIGGVQRAGWSVRIFKPEDGWRLVRSYEIAPTATGFAYRFTDGVIADGRFLYLIEFALGGERRVRVVDAMDGKFVAEFESDQAQTGILGGQYDWVNNKVWLGQLEGGKIFRYAGRTLPAFGTLTSSPVGPGDAWDRLEVTVVSPGSGRAEVDLLGEIGGGTFVALPGWTGLPVGAPIDLEGLDPSLRRLQFQVQLFGDGLAPSPGLERWQVQYRPVSDLGVFHLRAEPLSVKELAPITLTVDVLNQGPLDLVQNMTLGFYSGPPGAGRLIGRVSVPEAIPVGQKTSVSLVWNTARFGGRHLIWVRLEDLRGRPSFFNRRLFLEDPVEIAPSDDTGVPVIEISALDALGEVRPDDFLPDQPRFSVVMRDSSGIDLNSVQIRLTGSAEIALDDIASLRVEDRENAATVLSFVYGAPLLQDDQYVLEISGRDQIGNGPAQKALAFQVSSTLTLDQVLTSPNPMATDTDFTYILSRPATVIVRIYTVSGRLIRVLEDPFGRAGFNQLPWDGRDGDRHPVASGVYVYTVAAEDGETRVRVKDKVIVYR